ncbi:segregation/condensation protein A [Streptomyces sp. NPDC018610]|uniref:segregation and condensation protein A n=1 Tax=Streptomyces sp. NPDC018610 TaxID=3365049 RepID=UPI0037B30A85
MTSNDVPPAGPGRRRVLGRGPGASAPGPAPSAAPTPPQAPSAAEPPRPQEPAAPEDPARPEAPEASATPDDATRPEAPDEPAPSRVPGVSKGPARSQVRVTPVSVTPDETARPGAPATPDEPVDESLTAPVLRPRTASRSDTASRPVPVSGAAPAAAAAAAAQGGAGGGSGAGTGTEADEDGADGGVFKVRLSNFEGPFDLLLQLIAKHKLDVTEVALSKVTDEFMAHIRAMGPDWDLDETTEFLVVAATLLDLKAARLLPAAEVEDEADLALLEARDLLFARLLQYRAYKQIADIFNARLDEEARRYPRTVGLEPHHAELLPEVVISIGPEGFARLAVKAMQPRPKPQVYVDHIHAPLVSVQEQAAIVVARLRELGEAGFRTLVEDTDDTLTVVARFLALLELYREKAVALEQETALGELTVRWTGGDGENAPMVTDEFDRPPEQPEEPDKERKP